MSRRRLFSGARFRTAIKYFLVGRTAQALATLAITLVSVRILEPVEFGLFMLIWGLVEVGVPLTSLGLLPAVQRFLPELAEQGELAGLRRFIRWVTAARLVLVGLACLALLFGWEALLRWLGGGAAGAARVGWVVALLVAGVLWLRWCNEMQDALLEQRHSQFVRALFPMLRLAAMLVWWWTGEATLERVLLTDLAATVAVLLLAEVLLRSRLRALAPAGRRVVDLRELGTYVWHMSGAQVLNAAANVGVLRLVAARVLGLEAAGVFAFMQQLVTIANRYMPSVLFANLVRPMLVSRLATGDRQGVADGLGLLWKLNVLSVWPGVPLMLLVGTPLLAWLSGGRAMDAAWPMAWLTVALASLGQNQILTMTMQVHGRTALARGMGTLALLAPVAAWVGGAWGVTGLAAGYALALSLRSAINLAFLRWPLRALTLDAGGVFRPLAVLVLASLALWALQEATRLPWPWVAFGLLACYALGVRAVRPLSEADFDLLQRAFRAKAQHLRPWVHAARAG